MWHSHGLPLTAGWPSRQDGAVGLVAEFPSMGLGEGSSCSGAGSPTAAGRSITGSGSSPHDREGAADRIGGSVDAGAAFTSSPRRPGLPPHPDPRLRHAAGRHDRPRCGDRLRAAHRHSLPGEPPAGRYRRRRRHPRDEHRGPSRAVRRRDRDPRAARPTRARGRPAQRPGDRLRPRRPDHDAGGAHRPSGAALPLRKPHRTPLQPGYRGHQAPAVAPRGCGWAGHARSLVTRGAA